MNWTPVDEEKPRIETNVLAFGRDEEGKPICAVAQLRQNGTWWIEADPSGATPIAVTHWMPLPAPPAD